MSVTPIPDALRQAVIDRDGTACLRCQVQCGWAGKNRMHIDHIIPEVLGGRTVLDNLQVLCRTCNLRKGSMAWDYRAPQQSTRDNYRVTVEDHVVPGHRLTLYADYRGWRQRLRYTVVCQCGQRHATARTRASALLAMREHMLATERESGGSKKVFAGTAVVDLTNRRPIEDDGDLRAALAGRLGAAPDTAALVPEPAVGLPGSLPPKIAALADVLTPDEIERLLELQPA